MKASVSCWSVACSRPVAPRPEGMASKRASMRVLIQRLHRFCLQIGAQQAHAAVDVKAHSTRADDAILLAKGCHAADGKAVAQMGIGHGHGVLDNAGQGGHIGHLIYRSRLHHLPQCRGDKDSARHAHARSVADGHLVSIIVDLVDF